MLHYSKPRPLHHTPDHTHHTPDHTHHTPDHTHHTPDYAHHTPDYAHHTPGYTPGPRRSFDSSRYSPKIHSLPVELLSYIFLLSTHASSQQKTPPFTTESIRTPIIISSVDKHWRRVALTTPALWTNICVTVEMIGSGGGASAESESHLDTRHLTSFLKLSKSYPLNILIDARDQDWDFNDDDRLPSPPSPPPSTYTHTSSSSSHTHPPSSAYTPTYIPPFSPSHITTTLLLLLPHINRWRSLDILTDTYLPMHYALRLIHPELMRKGAEKLESLTLMRCNDFVSYGDEFEPRGLRDHNNNNSSSSDNNTTTTHLPPSQILPRLHHLTLRGIHIHWNSLSKILNSRICGCGGLKSLELSSHCMDVRPTKEEMRGILEGCKGGLGELVLVGSGSVSMSASVSNTTHQRTKKLKKGLPPVYLPNLKSFTLGYRSTRSGKELLEMVDAPGVERFTLEDASHPSDPEDIDAGKVLRYIGLGGGGGGGGGGGASSSSSSSLSSSIPTSTSTSSASPSTSTSSSSSVFPNLTHFTIRHVKACPTPFHILFRSLTELKSIEIVG
ncbi:hypothetical protein BDN72DRAFT_778085, partial [Pluteus cervinus]